MVTGRGLIQEDEFFPYNWKVVIHTLRDHNMAYFIYLFLFTCCMLFIIEQLSTSTFVICFPLNVLISLNGHFLPVYFKNKAFSLNLNFSVIG